MLLLPIDVTKHFSIYIELSFLFMAVLYVSRVKAIMFYACTLLFFFFFFFVSKGNLQSYWTDSIHTFTQYLVLV